MFKPPKSLVGHTTALSPVQHISGVPPNLQSVDESDLSAHTIVNTVKLCTTTEDTVSEIIHAYIQ